MPNEIRVTQGEPTVWAADTTPYIALGGLASNAARIGAGVDLGENFPGRCLLCVAIELATAPAAGATIDVYWAASHDDATWPGGVTGGAGIFHAGAEDSWARQLLYIGGLVVTANGVGTTQRQTLLFTPLARFGCPVLVNRSGQALAASNSNQKLTLVPLTDEIQ